MGIFACDVCVCVARSRYEVCDKLCAKVDSGEYDTVVVNFANPDMVGHTGSIPAVRGGDEVHAVQECVAIPCFANDILG